MSETRISCRFALFGTAIGRCGIAWRDDATAMVVASHLPEASDEATAELLARRAGGAVPGDPPEPVRRAIAAITALLAGEKTCLAFIACDLDTVEAFNARVYEVARTIAPGETCTYGDIATALGDKRLAQAVGRALGRNHWPIIVPCHRVLGAGGKLTGFSANGGVATKLRMLAIEGVTFGAAGGLFEDLPLALGPERRS